MSEHRGIEPALAQQYEAVFCVFMAAAAYLGQGNAAFGCPSVLCLILLLLAVNLAAIFALRRCPARDGVSAGFILANCAVITAVVASSGGARSELWVLYLLPIYSSAVMLNGRETAWIAAGAAGFNTALYAHGADTAAAGVLFELAVKDGLFVLSAALTWRVAGAERRATARLAVQRRELEALTESLRTRPAEEARNERLADVGLAASAFASDLAMPLKVIRGFAEVCLKDAALAEALKRDIESIDQAARFCEGLVSRVSSAVAESEEPHAPGELHGFIEAALRSAADAAAAAGVEVRRSLDPRPLAVTARPGQLQRVVRELISAALRAMPDGGTLTVRTWADHGANGRPTAQVIVEDTGPGFTVEELSTLFKAFSAGRAGEKGRGLGLYLCREIAVRHGGTLQAENRRTSGARYVLTLPLAGLAAGSVV